MPLMKSPSKMAFKHNIEAEMHAGKPQKQALAIAYATKRRSMAKGGMVQKVQSPAEIVYGSKSAKRGMMHENEDMPQEVVEQSHPREGAEHARMMEHVEDPHGDEMHSMGKNIDPYDAEEEEDGRHMYMGGYAEGGEVTDDLDLEKRASKGQLYSDEEDFEDEVPFKAGMSDEAELDEHDMGPHRKAGESMHGDEAEEAEEHKGILNKIMSRMRMRHMGRR